MSKNRDRVNKLHKIDYYEIVKYFCIIQYYIYRNIKYKYINSTTLYTNIWKNE